MVRNRRTGGSFLLWRLLLLCLLFLPGCGPGAGEQAGDQRDYDPGALGKNPELKYFVEANPLYPVLKYARADLDNDGRGDLVVIYNIGPAKNRMTIIFRKGEVFVTAGDVPAPVSDQMIQFRNIDEKPPMEFILQGRKGARAGYAIFRVEEGELVDLFGEGMDDCC